MLMNTGDVGDQLKKYFDSKHRDMIIALEEMVNFESPSLDRIKLDVLADRLAERLNFAGVRTNFIDLGQYGRIVHAKIDGTLDFAPILILCHYDTVWPDGTVKLRPFFVENNIVYGPGVYDMKASIVIVEFAIRSVLDMGLSFKRPINILFTPDEELISPASREIIQQFAKQSEYVLVMEPSTPTGQLKTSRKGVKRLLLEVQGKRSHAGTSPEQGASATEELMHQLSKLIGLRNSSIGTTINIGKIMGGIQWNMVADYAEAEVDIRYWSLTEDTRISNEILKLIPKNPSTKLNTKQIFSCPPMEANPSISMLFERVKKIGKKLNLDLCESSSGGGSDANFASSQGIPTLDGLGAIGDGAHSNTEYINIDSLSIRASLLALIIQEI